MSLPFLIGSQIYLDRAKAAASQETARYEAKASADYAAEPHDFTVVDESIRATDDVSNMTPVFVYTDKKTGCQYIEFDRGMAVRPDPAHPECANSVLPSSVQQRH